MNRLTLLITVGALFFCTAFGFAPQSGQEVPEHAVPVVLLGDVPGPTFRPLAHPLSLKVLTARVAAAAARLRSATGIVEVEYETIGPIADAETGAAGQSLSGRKPGVNEWQRYVCRWSLNGAKLSYRTISMAGNGDLASIFSWTDASFNGSNSTVAETYRQDGFNHVTIAHGPYQMGSYYSWDPRYWAGWWDGYLSTFASRLRIMRAYASVAIDGTEVVYGSRCYRLVARYHDGERYYMWLDIGHDLLIRRSEAIQPGHKQIDVDTAPTVVSSNGVWMPATCHNAQYALAIPGQYLRLSTNRFFVKDFVANRPVPSGAFHVPILPGSQVSNQLNTKGHQVPLVHLRH